MRRRAALILVSVAAIGALAAGCAAGEEKSATPQTVIGSLPEDTTPAVSVPEGDAAAGKEVFDSAGCGSCHTLADAGTTGTVGPNLDDAKPTAETTYTQVMNGGGGMPPFKDQLSEEQIADVTAYVVQATGGG
jgi:mono/diheme cytochrome c family protein